MLGRILRASRSRWETTLELVHKDYIEKAPYDPDYDVKLLVGVQWPDHAVLLEHSKWAVAPVKDKFRCIGSGEILGNYLADTMFEKGSWIMQGCIAAVHVLQQTKKYSPYCGFESDIRFMVKTGEVETVGQPDIAMLESYFNMLHANLQAVLSRGADPRIPPDVVETQARVFAHAAKMRPAFLFKHRELLGYKPQSEPEP